MDYNKKNFSNIEKEQLSKKNKTKSFKKLFAYIKPYWKTFGFCIFLSFVTVITLTLTPKYLGNTITYFFDIVKILNENNIDYEQINILNNQIINTIALLLVLYIISSISKYVQQLVSGIVSQKIVYKLRDDISKKINKIPVSFYTSSSVGDTLSIITNDIEIISSSLQQSIVDVFSTILTVILVITFMFQLQVYLAFLVLFIIIILSLVMFLLAFKSQNIFKKQRKSIGELNSYIEEYYSALDTIQAFNREKVIINKFDVINNNASNITQKSSFLSSIVFTIVNFFTNISYVLITFVGSFIVIKGISPIGVIPSFLQYFRQILNCLSTISGSMMLFQEALASTARVFDFLELDNDVDDGKLILKDIKNSIKFENITFRYDNKKTILEDFNLNIECGKSVGIVGKTGSGKTTLYNLLLNFYTPQKGLIKIDDIDIKEFTKKSLRDNIGIVAQDVWLFKGTIYENLIYGNTNCNKEDVIKAAKLSNADNFINKLPQGYDTVIDEEFSNLSEGQKQLLTITRTILKDPNILLLDEATSSIDTRTEILIVEALKYLFKGRTSFIIAHRLSTIKEVDIIIFLKNGKIVEKGSHKELLSKKGYYYNLYRTQFIEESQS